MKSNYENGGIFKETANVGIREVFFHGEAGEPTMQVDLKLDIKAQSAIENLDLFNKLVKRINELQL